MSQADFIKPKPDKARVIIKSHEDRTELPFFELDWEMEKSDALQLIALALELKGKREQS